MLKTEKTTLITERKRRTRRSPTAAREHILDCAEELLTEGGLQSMTLSAVASKAGYSQGNLLIYFGAVGRLQEALFRRLVRRLTNKIEILQSGLTWEEYAEAVADLLFDSFSSDRQARLAAWLELSGDSRRLSIVRRAIESALKKRGGTDVEGLDEFKDRIALSVALAIGAGLCGGSMATLMGRPKGTVKRLTTELLRDAVPGTARNLSSA